MSWQWWVILSGVVTGVAQMIGKSQIHKISALQMGVLRDVTGWVVGLGLWIVMGMVWAGNAMWIGFFNGAVVAVGVALYFIAVRSSFSGASVFGYLISQVLIVISSAFVFGEWVYFDPSTTRGIGNLLVLLLTIFSMLMYSQVSRHGGRWKWLLLMSALINVVGNMVAKSVVSGPTDVWAYFFAEQTGLAVMGVVILVVRGQGMLVGWQNAKVGILQGLVAVTGPIIYLHVLSTEPLSLASLVRRIAAIMVTSASGLWWYKEGKNLGVKGWVSLIIGMIAFLIVLWVNT